MKPCGHEHDVDLEIASYLPAEIYLIQLPTKTP